MPPAKDKPSKDGPGKDEPPRRLNRAVGIAEALGRALDPVMKKRGFASRDIITHWAAMAPAPYDQMARPEKLSWPRGEAGAEGAVLHLRCHPGHALALAHEGQRVAAAINRYFGYFLVGQVRLSAAPFETAAPRVPAGPPPLPEVARAQIARTVAEVSDPDMRDALKQLGQAIARKKAR